MPTSRIGSISASDASRLCSGQVITTLVDAVKELLDNSLDSGASSIEIRLQDSGVESIEVVDDGRGIPEADLEKVCEKYATSKITSFDDLNTVKSFGFRGEALSSLASLSSGVRIHTKTEELEIGFKVEYNRNGGIVKKSRFPRTRGTTVKVIQLFSSLPVRQKYLKEKIKQQLAKLVSVVKGYSFANIHLKLLLVNQCGNDKKELLNITPATELKQMIHSLVSHDPIFSEIYKSVIFEEVADEFGVEPSDENVSQENLITFIGFISTPKHGKSNSDWQFISINSRPIDYPKLAKIINQVYRSFDPTGSGNQYPVLVLNLQIPPEMVDVNVTPDKRTVFVSNEKVLFALVKSSILKLFSTNVSSFEQTKYNQSSSQMTVISSDDLDDDIEESSPNISVPTPQIIKKNTGQLISKQITDFYEPTERPARSAELLERRVITSTAALELPDFPGFRPASTAAQASGFQLNFVGSSTSKAAGNPFLSKTSVTDFETAVSTRRRSLTPDFDSSFDRSQTRKRMRQLSSSPPSGLIRNTSGIRSGDLSSSFRPLQTSSPVAMPPPKIPTITIGDNRSGDPPFRAVIDDEAGPIPTRPKVKCSFDFSQMLESTPVVGCPADSQSKFTPNLDEEDDNAAMSTLDRELNKSQFREMRIIGQFNKGFIITEIGSTLFVVDQHASDERRNFDELLESMQLDCQPLIKPIPLSLTGYDEYLINENIDVFTRNGFKFSYQKECALGKRYSIVAVPTSGDRVFGIAEFDEILDVVKESPTAARSMRPTKVKEMLAMKACRKSIMIGDDLSRQDMAKVIQRMAETSNPWTCAHGRPTVRCLGTRKNFQKY